jgi:hypothetical protein
MARKRAGELNYAEDTSGTFGSGWTPGVKTGGFPASNPVASPAAVAPSKFDSDGTPTVKGGKTLYPQGGRPMLGGMGPESPEQAQARVLGTNKIAPIRTPAQMLAQNDFDVRMGLKPSWTAEHIKAVSDAINPTKAGPTAVLKNSDGDVVGVKSPLDALQTIGAPVQPATGTALLATPGAPALPQAPANTFATQNAPRIPGYSGGDPATAGAVPDVAGAVKSGAGVLQSAGSAVEAGAGKVFAGLNRATTESFNPMAPRAPGGDAIPSGVSRATAAGFEKPTKDSPVPKTPTTPSADIDKTDTSLSQFGMDDEEAKRRKAFAGFGPLAQNTAQPEEDVPPGAPGYNRGPLTNPTPTPVPTPEHPYGGPARRAA